MCVLAWRKELEATGPHSQMHLAAGKKVKLTIRAIVEAVNSVPMSQLSGAWRMSIIAANARNATFAGAALPIKHGLDCGGGCRQSILASEHSANLYRVI